MRHECRVTTLGLLLFKNPFKKRLHFAHNLLSQIFGLLDLFFGRGVCQGLGV